MNDFSTTLLQIVSTQLTHEELSQGISLRNFARQQPEPPSAYYCFDSSSLTTSDNINEHIEKLALLTFSSKKFLLQRSHAGDEISLLWFPGKNCSVYSILSPKSMVFLSELNISFLICNKGNK